MKKLLLPAMGLAAFCLYLVACSKAHESDLVKNGNGNTCDTVNMTYTANVLPILQNNCYPCHGNGQNMGGVQLDNFATLETLAHNGTLYSVITHASGYPAMPEGGAKLSDCDINKIQDWINHGAQNN